MLNDCLKLTFPGWRFEMVVCLVQKVYCWFWQLGLPHRSQRKTLSYKSSPNCKPYCHYSCPSLLVKALVFHLLWLQLITVLLNPSLRVNLNQKQNQNQKVVRISHIYKSSSINVLNFSEPGYDGSNHVNPEPEPRGAASTLVTSIATITSIVLACIYM